MRENKLVGARAVSRIDTFWFYGYHLSQKQSPTGLIIHIYVVWLCACISITITGSAVSPSGWHDMCSIEDSRCFSSIDRARRGVLALGSVRCLLRTQYFVVIACLYQASPLGCCCCCWCRVCIICYWNDQYMSNILRRYFLCSYRLCISFTVFGPRLWDDPIVASGTLNSRHTLPRLLFDAMAMLCTIKNTSSKLVFISKRVPIKS